MKKIISTLLIFIILLSTFVLATDDDTYSPKVPKLLFIDVTSIPEVNAGDYLNLKLTLRNDSNNPAQKITITPEIGELPISWERPTDFYTLASLGRRTQTTVNYNFKINSSAKIGTYGIKFDFNFYNTRGEVYTSAQTVYFKVVKEQLSPVLTIGEVSTNPTNVVAGQKTTLSFELKNIGDLTATSIAVTLNNLSKDTFMPAGSSDTQYIEVLNGKSSEKLFFDLMASKNITKGTNEIEVLIKYLNQNGAENTTIKKIYINDVSSNNEVPSSESGKPKIIIDSYYTNPSKIVAGDNIDFGFTFTNTNSNKTIKNIKIVVSSENGAFNISKGSNTFYVESLGPKSSIQKSIGLNVKQDLTSNSYPINIMFDYEDSNEGDYNCTETINLPVTEYSKLVINSVYCEGGMVGNTTSLSFDYINMGKAKISNLVASVEGDFEAKQSVNYIGNLEAGSSDYYDIEIVPNKSGDSSGTLVLSFEDSSGKKIETRKDFSTFVMEEIEYIEPGNDILIPDISIEENTINIWKVIGYGVASLVISFFVTKLIATKIIRKKLEDEI